MGVLNGSILIFVRPLVGIYELSGETMELSIILACIHAGFAMLLWPLSFVLPNALRAANDVKFTMIVSIASMACWRVGFSYIIGVRRLDRHGGGLGLPRDLLRDPLPQRRLERKI